MSEANKLETISVEEAGRRLGVGRNSACEAVNEAEQTSLRTILGKWCAP